ncbi:Uncharacterised protein [Mycobacterium tuberculosis]|nr:Uncharacterised protein [Mycobacterium tuberculosis]
MRSLIKDRSAATPMRCGSEDPCTIAVTSWFCRFHALTISANRVWSVAGKKYAGLTLIVNTSR